GLATPTIASAWLAASRQCSDTNTTGDSTGVISRAATEAYFRSPRRAVTTPLRGVQPAPIRALARAIRRSQAGAAPARISCCPPTTAGSSAVCPGSPVLGLEKGKERDRDASSHFEE